MDIICIESQTPGNLGAIARTMKNFEFENLVLLNPKCSHLDKEALDRATHAKEILQKAKIVKELKYDTLIGTTAILGTDYNLIRTPITPEALAQMDLKGNVGLVIGREADGMRNEELKACDIVVSIPTSKKYPTMNVSHATTILLYELFKASKKEKIGQHIKPAKKEDKERLLALIDEKMECLTFTTEYKKRTQRTLWKNVIGKSNLSKRELMALFGFMKKIK
ncbi:TrmJ/YjtD family RNA methyltransferase [Candidatus Woesearchaeota archaeon]|nr:TrmJ/YjtD family RNA methyltransferase [Candidatus Woesearchaeota archaeon]